ncbi:hypothetical protein TD95_004544 [Thielaviopsis punctulata]|uniref:ATP12 chaperone protein n=1 Tax=Thielaviopsis punctulata TaxID=72032 RepID=A0A0F4ZM13_9PEZI|nr:hypothetical protein TD95_004544 [Thielaviopsis punctulata]
MSLLSLSRALLRPSPSSGLLRPAVAGIHSATATAANVSPLVGTGPPPDPPMPSAAEVSAMSRVARRRRQAEMLREAKSIRNGKGEVKTVKRRFWTDVSVREVDGSLQVFLDARPLRHPTTKEILRLPRSKHALATALAIEWDSLTSAQDASKAHLLPLTSLVCRAVDIAADAASIRPGLERLLLRYLDTDSVLCWAPEPPAHMREAGPSLRDAQRAAADALTAWLAARLWPGAVIEPVLDEASIIPRPQPAHTRHAVETWVAALDAWDLAGLERAVISGKSFLVAARLLAEWSESAGVVAPHERAWGADEAALAANMEVDWQTGRWGEVEDTHDVEKQDIRRHYGSVILLVSGSKTA